MDYKDTLNLPNTKFPMKANLPAKEPQIGAGWEEAQAYAKIQELRKDAKKYILHDGPPYANGHIHIGHVLNKTLKDVVVKYKTMRGFSSDYIPGWDCHGLPVEHQLFKELKKKKTDIPKIDFRKKARNYAMKFVGIQRDEFKRLGIFGDWQHPYLTLNKGYEESIIRSFARLVEQDYIYKGLKPVNYCYDCETALAEAEVEYDEHTSPSVYVKFRLKDGRLDKLIKDKKPAGDDFILIWTTTPWTLIANVAVAVHPAFQYVVVRSDNGNIIMAEPLLSQVMEAASKEDYQIISAIKGADLEGMAYEHPMGLREGRVVLADYVSMEEGTGCVHTAPGHGQEDYLTGQKYKLSVVMPVDEKGNFTEEAGKFKGMNVHKANPVITEELRDLGLLLHDDKITHSYPHCWRCKNPIIFRATEQWFMSVDHNSIRAKILDEIKKVQWVPPQGEERISSMVENRPDWCLSRQRHWGVPIPVFFCKACESWIADHKAIDYFADIVKDKGANAWFELSVQELLPTGYKCPSCDGDSAVFQKGEDIVDVWFESGVSHQGVLKRSQTLAYPADLYLEGSDQHRGWFQSAIITAMAIDGHAPFKSVLTHGFVVDGEGRKMSKSLGNVISPQDIIKDYGADILRLWVASSDYNDDVRISDTILARLTEAYRKIRNTTRFILGNLSDFDPDKDSLSYDQLLEIDKWATSRLGGLIKDVSTYYDEFKFHKVYHSIYSFCVTDMSNFYLDVLKDRLYISAPGSLERRSCQSVMHEIAKGLVAAIAPILVYTAEELWQHMPKSKSMPESVHLSLWPDVDNLKIDRDLEARWNEIIGVRDLALKALEQKRNEAMINSSLQAKVIICAESDKIYSLLDSYKHLLSEILIVSQSELKKGPAPHEAFKLETVPGLSIVVQKADGEKCNRCWNYSPSVGEDKDHPQLCCRCCGILDTIAK